MARTGHGLVGPDAVAQRIHADPSTLVAGMRALLVQVAHPHVAAGVAQHSDYRGDPWGRLDATTSFVYAVTYGSESAAQRAVEVVRRVHEHVRGVDPATGQSYRASDPHLLRWVHVALTHSIVAAYRRYGGWLPVRDADRYVAEMAEVAVALGVPDEDVPRTLAALRDAVRSADDLQVTASARDVLALMRVPPVAAPARPAAAIVVAAALGTLPRWMRTDYGDRTPPPADAAVRAATLTMLTALRVGAAVPRRVLGPDRLAALTRPLQVSSR